MLRFFIFLVQPINVFVFIHLFVCLFLFSYFISLLVEEEEEKVAGRLKAGRTSRPHFAHSVYLHSKFCNLNWKSV